MYKALSNRHRSPRNRDRRNPVRSADILDEDVARDLKDDVSDEEDEESDTSTVPDVKAQILVDLGYPRDGGVGSIDVGDCVDDSEEWEDSPVYFWSAFVISMLSARFVLESWEL